MSLECGSTSKGLGCTTIDSAHQRGTVIPGKAALTRLRQKDLGFQASLGYIESFRLAWAT